MLEQRIRNVPVDDVQFDEIWTYVKKKEGRKIPTEKGRGYAPRVALTTRGAYPRAEAKRQD